MMLTLLHSKLFDVGDIPVLTFGALKTGLIKWSLKLYVRFYVFNVFFVIQKTSIFTFFLIVAHVFSKTGYPPAGRPRFTICHFVILCLQCFDAVGWAAGMAPDL